MTILFFKVIFLIVSDENSFDINNPFKKIQTYKGKSKKK